MEDAITDAGVRAFRAARPAEAGLAVARAEGVGSNRRDPSGPADPEVPVLLVRGKGDRKNIAAMAVYCMHPTVLHEDSTLITGDFPAMTRQYLQRTVLGPECPLVYHSGPEGNQSPRHVVRGQTFAEAQRLGENLGRCIEKAIPGIRFRDDLAITCATKLLQLPRRHFASVPAAQAKLDKAAQRLEHLRKTNAPRAQTRTAECDWFGAEETLTLARAEADGRLDGAAAEVLPAEVHVIKVGPWSFVGWPGEMFVEYGLAVKARRRDTYVIALANGELQGYIVTPEAEAAGGYEACNSLFEPRAGTIMVEETLRLMRELAD